MGAWTSALALVVAAHLSAGCIAGNEATEFPPGLELLEENTAPRLPAKGGDSYPEELSLVTGENDSFLFGHARGYLHAPAAAVWAALADPEVVADRRQTDSHAATLGVEPQYETSYQIHYVVNDIITVEWDENYRLGTVAGSAEAPELAHLRHQKVYGFELIDLIEGSMLVRRIDDEVTELELIRHIDAPQTDEARISRYLEDLYASVLARVHGQPLPTY